MDRLTQLTACAALMPALNGCGSESNDSTTASISSASPASTADALQTTPDANYPTDPRAVVAQFLDASLRGDRQQRARFLTPKALQQMREHGTEVFLGSDKSARFTVGGVEKLVEKLVEKQADSTLLVQSTWTELDQYGNPQSEELFWVMKQSPAGWHISGVAKKLSPGNVVQVNYEDPEGIDQIEEQLDSENRRQSGKKTSGPSQSIDRFQTGPR